MNERWSRLLGGVPCTVKHQQMIRFDLVVVVVLVVVVIMVIMLVYCRLHGVPCSVKH